MKVTAIICEYNPFHKGHQFHIQEARRQTGADAIVAVMSGNFVQRGDAAVFSKELRAKAAILGGADLVLELPTAYATGSAEFFATGAVKILDSLGIVDCLSFGAETPDTEKLSKIAELLIAEPTEFANALKAYSKSGLSFPAARAMAVGEILADDTKTILSAPNNILGIEYCKALLKLHSSIKPIAAARTGAGHNSNAADGGIASATLIRELLLQGKQSEAFLYMPDFAKELFENVPPHSVKELEEAILCELLKISADKLKDFSDVTEGLENRIKNAVLTSVTLDELINTVKTKRYTRSRIQRILLSVFLGITDNDRRTSPKYIKVLAHNEFGQKLIAAAKKTAALPIIRNTSQVNKLGSSEVKAMWERERSFDKIYEFTKK